MGFLVKPALTDLTYGFAFKDPLLEQLKEEARLSFIGKLAKEFSLSASIRKYSDVFWLSYKSELLTQH
jgi:hypothetical protein